MPRAFLNLLRIDIVLQPAWRRPIPVPTSLFKNSSRFSTAPNNNPNHEHAQPISNTDSEQAQNESSSRQQERVLYERRPDWYIRLIPLLIVLDIAMLYVRRYWFLTQSYC